MASLFIFSLISTLVISNTVLAAKLSEKGVSLKAPLLHWSSPESPYYKPNSTKRDLIQASIRASHARTRHIGNKISGKYSGKWAVSPVTWIDGEFVMKFSVGTPPVDTYATPDTGSDLVWLQCGSPSCSHCFKQRNPYFDPSKSTTYKRLQCRDPDCRTALGDQHSNCKQSTDTCTYHAEYADGSYSEGVVIEDVFTFVEDLDPVGNYTIKDAIFGCGFKNTQGIPDPDNGYEAPGIVGLSSEPSSLVSQLTLGHLKLFSYCIAQEKENAKIEIRFGIAASVSGDSTALAPNKYGLYFLRDVEGLYSDENKIKAPEWVFQYADGGLGGVLIDTGTTNTIFNHFVVENLVLVLKDQIAAVSRIDESNSGYSLCYEREEWSSVTLPDIELRFKNSTTAYSFTIDNSWIENGEGQYCLAFLTSNNMSTIGIRQQRGIKFGYDLEANTVSFWKTNNCAPWF
ncbi:aspartic proteinase CDR1-like [Euphorbia lathyris]|uniref:aspartic proteinase CDR1-like n=1 Tax=Euphorbia lathyris TaxID=212925 RepID=UPI003313B068